tara:strand:+ start:27 stop:1052 length:1026 start_codon:yes stop_codon:yes gene_type:complete
MKKNNLSHTDELDLTVLLMVLWNGKIKILLITIISFLAGIGYSYQMPNNYLNLLTINAIDNSELKQINYVNKLLKSDDYNQLNNLNQLDKLDESKRILDKFINELRDFEEFVITLKNNKKIQDEISKLKIDEQEVKLFKYAKLLKIISPKKDEKYYILSFTWYDPDDAKKRLQDTLKLTSNNLKKKIINGLLQNLEFKKKLKLRNDSKRLNFLNEQSIIAKELNIVDNQIDNLGVNSQSNVTLSINTADIAYYLRGYRAIDKEIELIKKREYKNLELIEKEIYSLKDKDINFVDYNVYLMETEGLKNMKLILLISIVIGLLVGVFYVIISNTIQSTTISKK